MEWFKQYARWRIEGLKGGDGIVIGSDRSQEWLLPWWWENFKKHNRSPVTFVDFGLSEEMKTWCRDRGELAALPFLDVFIQDREEIPAAVAEDWEARYGDHFWQSRKAWFKKPLACLQSPYQRTLWLDLDCEILGPLDDLFNACDHVSGIALVKDRASDASPISLYNSGVIAFQRDLPLLSAWADQSFERNGAFRGDQDLLSQLIFEHNLSICELPAIYNWNIGYGLNPQAVICHWIGDAAKNVLRNQSILKQFI